MRHWKCGSFENAELISIGFDYLALANPVSDAPATIFIDGPPKLMKRPLFENYVQLLDPGEYALSSPDVKVARSSSNVGRIALQPHR